MTRRRTSVTLFSLTIALLAALAFTTPVRPQGDNDPNAPQLVVQTGHSSEVKNLWLSPDENFLISRSDDRLIIWDIRAGQPLRSLEKVTIDDISADGRFVATKDENENFSVWHIATGKFVFSAKGNSCSFNLSGKLYVCDETERKAIVVRQSADGKELRLIKPANRIVEDFSFASNERIVVSSRVELTEKPADGAPLNFIDVFELEKPDPVFTVFNRTKWGVSRDGRLILAEGEKADVFDIGHGSTPIWSSPTLTDWSFSPTGKYLIAEGKDKVAHVFNLETGRETFSKKVDTYIPFKFTPNDRFLYEFVYDAEHSGANSKLDFYRADDGGLHLSLRASSAFNFRLSPNDQSVAVSRQVGKIWTLDLWDIAAKKLIVTSPGHSTDVDEVAFRPDGRSISAAFLDDGRLDITLVDPQTGALDAIKGDATTAAKVNELINTLPLQIPDSVMTMANSVRGANEPKIYTLSIRLSESNKQSSLPEFESYSGNKMVFAERAGLLIRGMEDGTISLWDLASEQRTSTLERHASPVAVTLSKEKKRLQFSDGSVVKYWDLEKGGLIGQDKIRPEKEVQAPRTWFDDYTVDYDRRADEPNSFSIKNTRTGAEYIHETNVQSCDINYTSLFYTCYRGSQEKGEYDLEVKDLRTKRLKFTIKNVTGKYGTPDDPTTSKYIAVRRFDPAVENSVSDPWLELWNVTGTKVFQSRTGVDEFVVDDDAGRVLLGFEDGLELHDLKTGKNISGSFGDGGFGLGLEDADFHLSPSQRMVVITWPGRWGEKAERVAVWDTKTDAMFWGSEHSANLLSTEFSPDERFLFSTSVDGTVKVWDIAKQTDIMTMILLDDEDWVVVDKEGRFDASDNAARLMKWRVGNDVISFEQLTERFYQPYLWARTLGYDKTALRDVKGLKTILLPPDVEVVAANSTANSTIRTVKITNRGGGIGRVQVFVNGVEFLEDARDEKLKADPNAKEYTLSFDIKGAPLYASKPSTVKVTAWNYDPAAIERFKGYASSRGTPIEEKPQADKAVTQRLFAIIGGVSDYDGDQIDLKYAAKDAQDMYTAISIGGKNLFGVDKMKLTLLSTGKAAGAVPPTKENFRRALADFAKEAKPEDTLFVYLSGHGITLNGSDTYYYLTQEASTTNRDTMAKDSGLLARSTISSEELTGWLKDVPALRKVLILDTCAAGALGNEFRIAEKKDLSADAKRALERMKGRLGFHVLMGSASDAVSYEASQYGQGLLTYSLLQGMKGAALKPDGEVDVSLLFNYAADEVPKLARNIGGIQRPAIRVPAGGESFALGMIQSAADKQSIPLALVKPLILKAQLFDEAVLRDTLEIEPLLNGSLRELAATATARGSSPIVFVETGEMADAILPRASYRVVGDRINLRLVLSRNNKPVGPPIPLIGNKNDLNALVKQIIAQIVKAR